MQRRHFESEMLDEWLALSGSGLSDRRGNAAIAEWLRSSGLQPPK